MRNRFVSPEWRMQMACQLSHLVVRTNEFTSCNLFAMDAFLRRSIWIFSACRLVSKNSSFIVRDSSPLLFMQKEYQVKRWVSINPNEARRTQGLPASSPEVLRFPYALSPSQNRVSHLPDSFFGQNGGYFGQGPCFFVF